MAEKSATASIVVVYIFQLESRYFATGAGSGLDRFRRHPPPLPVGPLDGVVEGLNP